MSGAGSLIDLWISKISKMQNTDGILILTAEGTKNKIAKTSKIYLNILFFVTSAVRISLPSVLCIIKARPFAS